MKDKVLLFGGTTEGRVLSECLRKENIPHTVSVATEYGLELLKEGGEQSVISGRKSASEIAELITDGGFTVVVDSTHPFATLVSKEVRDACRMTDTKYLRLKRDTESSLSSYSGVVYVDSLDEAVKELEKSVGNILLLTGSRDLEKITAGLSDISRVFARVLPDEESINKCIRAGLFGRQIIAMQGPFSQRMNEALIREIGASVILTKESGKTGGLNEKLLAAKSCGIKAIIIKNPENSFENEEVYSLFEIIEKLTGKAVKENVAVHDLSDQEDGAVTLAGLGPGDDRFYTKELVAAMNEADVIFGAEGVLKKADITNEVPKIAMYKGEDIHEYLKKHSEFTHPLVLFSGDISLCSGAKSAEKVLSNEGYPVNTIPGISSVSLFAKALGLGIEDVNIISAHGRKCNVPGHVAEAEKTIILPSNAEHALEICKSIKVLADRIVIGYELGTENEKIFDYEEENEASYPREGRCLVYVENAAALKKSAFSGIRDEEFLRGSTPMTKEEIRALSIRKLALTKRAILYDIGAGTGSISVEAALLSPDISVYSVEIDGDAIEILESNREKFGVTNMEIVHGSAPGALENLPAPTHAFIGGSGGNLREIVRAVFDKNESTVIVLNCVTAETFGEVMGLLEEDSDITSDIIQVFVSRYREVGSYHMADAINPVHIITLKKGNKVE